MLKLILGAPTSRALCPSAADAPHVPAAAAASELLCCALGFEGSFLSNKPVTAAGEHTRRWKR